LPAHTAYRHMALDESYRSIETSKWQRSNVKAAAKISLSAGGGLGGVENEPRRIDKR